MELLFTGGWFAYRFRVSHGRRVKIGMLCDVKRNKDGVVIIRVMLKHRKRIAAMMLNGKINDNWGRVEEPTVFPIRGTWYIEGLDPRQWKKGRRAL